MLVTAGFFASCVEENLGQTPLVPNGDDITFGVRAGYEKDATLTKTSYDGEDDIPNGSDGKINIDWNYNSDKVEVYCPEARIQQAHYSVVKDSDERPVLERIGDASLQWADETTEHNFYAMYPSSKVFEEDELTTLDHGVKMEGTKLLGVVPAMQNPLKIEPKVVSDITRYIARPNMKYAYMAARTLGMTKNKDGKQQNVSLNFVPIVTSVQIELQVPEAATGVENVDIAEIYVEGTGIAGKFTADLTKSGWPADKTYPKCENVDAGANRITISTWQTNDKGESIPLSLAQGQSLVFTVFLRPGSAIEDLQITISETGGEGLTKKLSGLKIQPHFKTIVQDFMLPAKKIEIDNSGWAEILPNETPLKNLSIPGTGNSFSYKSTDPTLKSQTLDFEQQWNMGIRAFEITTDRPNNANAKFADEYVKCNTASVGVKVQEVFDLIKEKLKDNHDEFAMVILNYQPEGSVTPRNIAAYASAVAVFYDEYNTDSIFQLFSPELTLGTVKGKIMLVMRTNQEDEDPAEAFNAVKTAIGNRNILAVDGCGSGKDKWRRRGYKDKVTGTPAFNIWDSDPDEGAASGVLIEDYMITTAEATYFLGRETAPDINEQTWEWDNKVTGPSDPYGGNFSYACTQGNSTKSFKVWYQEWARVVREDTKFLLGTCSQTLLPSTRNPKVFYYVLWKESYKEKLANAKYAFNAAINGGIIDDTPHVFINSLCGYFVDTQSDYNNSCYPYMQNPDVHSSHILGGSQLDMQTGGQKGNIAALASEINKDFYNYVLEKGLNNTSGPTGVILMDRVSNSKDDGGSYYLPGVIIGNNFKYRN